MTTVDVSTTKVTLVQALNGWLKGDQAVVPRASVFPPGQTAEEVEAEQTQEFALSQQSAVSAALCELGYPKSYGVFGVEPNLGAYGILKAGDSLVSVNGKPVDDREKLRVAMEAEKSGTVADVAITRNGKPMTVRVKLSDPAPGGKGARLGISVDNTCLAPFTVSIGLDDRIGGPSAGLMFALGIMEKIGTQELTGGTFIAGTGTIETDGTVGPIGGIQLKMIAAKEAGATVFLAPIRNCEDVRGAVPKGLNVVSIESLKDAVSDLLALQKGAEVSHC